MANRAASCGSRAHTLDLSLFLAFVVLAPVVAQETGQKLDVPAPKIGQITNPPPKMSLLAKSAPESEVPRSLQKLAIELLKYAPVPSCQQTGRAILVTDFVLPDGNTSRYGMWPADELSQELASPGNKIQVIDRGLLHDTLISTPVLAKSMDEQLARSIAPKLKATFVVVGTSRRIEDDMVQPSARLLPTAIVTDKDWNGNAAAVNLYAPKTVADLSPLERFSFLPPIPTSASGEKLYWPGVDSVTSPRCYYMPNPPDSEGLEGPR